MIILDTNVLSEFMRQRPEPLVMAWIAAQPRGLLYTTSINKVEIRYGLARLPEGRKRTALVAAAETIFAGELDGRVLPFDEQAADQYAEIVVTRRREGRPIDILDAQIAAIALAVGAEVATRDIGGFEGCGLGLIDPWAGPVVCQCGSDEWRNRLRSSAATLADIPAPGGAGKWNLYCNDVSDNFRIISPKDFRILA